jgi:hydroxypyruvate isomerase
LAPQETQSAKRFSKAAARGALANAAGVVDYVQVADVPGRGEPGSGDVDWADRLAVLRASGYRGPLGLEYFPTIESVASLAHIRSVAATV